MRHERVGGSSLARLREFVLITLSKSKVILLSASSFGDATSQLWQSVFLHRARSCHGSRFNWRSLATLRRM